MCDGILNKNSPAQVQLKVDLQLGACFSDVEANFSLEILLGPV